MSEVAAVSEDTLAQRLLRDPQKRSALLRDCERVIAEEVDAKGGLTGIAIKGAYKIVCKVKPGIIREVMDGLLDDFVARMEPFYTTYRSQPSGTFSAFLRTQSGAVADALLGITDDRAKRSSHQTLKSAYEKLRPQGKKHVEEAIPRVAKMIETHL